ncbi:MAG: hypothetical protein JSW06_03000 [Thermoplasmatales archaeon]|nr:MAG: hypothetical protein JSW06_03000 [Thermoplasmatales archaeon]
MKKETIFFIKSSVKFSGKYCEDNCLYIDHPLAGAKYSNCCLFGDYLEWESGSVGHTIRCEKCLNEFEKRGEK